MSTPTITRTALGAGDGDDPKFLRRLLAQTARDAEAAIAHFEQVRSAADATGDYFGLRHEANGMLRTLKSINGAASEFVL